MQQLNPGIFWVWHESCLRIYCFPKKKKSFSLVLIKHTVLSLQQLLNINYEGLQEHSLVTARYVLVWTSPAEFLAKHWNIPVSSGRRPLTCRLPPTSTLYLGVFTGSMGKASLYHTMSGWGTPAEGERRWSSQTEGQIYYIFPKKRVKWIYCCKDSEYFQRDYL